MEVIHERCVGLDVHKETVVGCVRVMEQLEQTVREFEAQIEAALEPFRAAVERLMTIPGVSATAASVIIAEIGST